MRSSSRRTWGPAVFCLIGIGVLAGASGAGCYSGGPLGGSSPAPSSSTGASEPDAGIPFQADPPDVYVAKVKNILTGLAPTSDELNQVVADPTALSALVTKWQTDPAFAPFYQAKMQVFFELAFQQTQINAADFAQMIPEGGGIGVSGTLTNLLVQNVRESFARTMVAMTTANQPFTNSFTTNQFMMTPPLMELYAFLDSNQIRDDESVNDRFKAANAGVSIMMEASAGAIPLSETLDSTSPNYMHWYYPDVASVTNTAADCNVDPRVYPATADTLHLLMYGSLQNYKGSAGTLCGFFGGKVTDSQFTTADFSAWKLVTVRQPVGGEATTQFFNVPALRTANELVLSTPRIGFFTTPAFFANWQTNTSNEMRVTMNQTLIVGTGMDVDGTDKTTTGATPPGLDSAHAAVGSACFGCHQTLDPSRSVFQNVYSYGYGNQDEAALVSQPGEFAFQGVIQPVSSMTDLGSVLKNHPAFAQAWVEKLCYYVNSQPCAPDDPELTRIVGDFKTGGYNWNALVHDLVTSPITTNATESRTAAEEGELVAVSRRDHFCALLNNRLGLVDVCGLDALSAKAKIATIAEVASGLPSDGYGRGAPIPVLPNAPSLFSRAGTENICEGVAQELVDATTPIAGALQISSAQSATSIQTLVSTLMGLPTSDPRNAQAVTVLTSHYTSAMSQGASATDAMKSTFITACLAPSVVGMGM